MKKYALLVVLLIMGVSSSSAHFMPHGSVGVSFSVFYSSLGPYGDWIPLDDGVYAWRPVGVAVGWRPYMYGRWIWTDDGWYWASDEPWSWAAYHYGRWYYDDFYGWMWIPGYDWAPAWVEWRYGGDYIGWAPLGPYAVFHIGFGIRYSHHWVTPAYYWSFVDCRYVGSPNIHRYVYRTNDNTRYIGRTRTVGNVRYDRGRIVSRGPDRDYVERRGKISVPRADVMEVNDRPVERLVRNGDRERIEVYRPRIEEGSAEKERPEKIRESGRKIDIDSRQIDVRSREVDREAGRDIRRSEEYKDRQRTQPDVDAQRREARPERRDAGRRREEASPRQEQSSMERSQRPVEREQPAVRQERPRMERQVERKQEVDQPRERSQKQVFRSPNPERTVRRSEARQEQKRESGRTEGPARRDRRR